MENRNEFIPECFIDTCMVESLLECCVNHQKGCNHVASVMKTKFDGRFAVGIIDNDKRRVSYLDDFYELDSTESRCLVLYKHKSKPHYFILVSPAMDSFVMKCAQDSALDLSIYNLPSTLDDFKRIAKSVNTKGDFRFKQLAKDLKKSSCEDISRFQAWLLNLKANPYTFSVK